MLAVQEHLRRVKSGAGHWHELAKLLPVLHAAGFDSVFIEQEAGVERATQNRWTVSMQVAPRPHPDSPCLTIAEQLLSPVCATMCACICQVRRPGEHVRMLHESQDLAL